MFQFPDAAQRCELHSSGEASVLQKLKYIINNDLRRMMMT